MICLHRSRKNFTKGEGDGIESKLPFKIFSTLPNCWTLVRQICFNVNLITDFKTVGLCLEKIPQNDMGSNWKPNHHKMRDLMTTAMVANEQKMKKSQERRNRMIERGYNVGNAPNISERTHVGNKTPVLGSMDLVTGTFFQSHRGNE